MNIRNFFSGRNGRQSTRRFLAAVLCGMLICTYAGSFPTVTGEQAPDTVPVTAENPQSRTLLDIDEVPISTEDELWNALKDMQDGESRTLRLTNAISLTKSMELNSAGSYSVTIIGSGEDTILSSDYAIRLFTVDHATVTLVLDDVVLDGNDTASGIIARNNAVLTLTGSGNSVIRGMKDTNGAALRISEAVVNLDGMTLEDNQADKNGGAVYSYSSKITVGNSHFNRNTAGESGGALYQYDTPDKINITASSFTYNTAGANGGAVAALSSGLHFRSTVILGNQAANGGGIFLRTGNLSSQLYLENSSRVEDNTAVYHGGGAYVDSATAGVFVQLSSVVANNKAENGNGGGLYLHQSSNVHINNATISDNTANNGGGIFLYDSNTLTCASAQVKDNVARENGGGVFTSINTSISNTTFSGNEAKNGGGLYKTNAGTRLILNSASFNGNKATANGGAIGLDVNAWNISAGMSIFTRNSASFAVGNLTTQQQAIHNSIMMTNTAYGTFTYTNPFTHALNNFDVWNTGDSDQITYDANVNGETVAGMPKDDQEYAVGADILLPLTNPVRLDHTFLGWSENKNADLPEYEANPTASTKEEQDLWYTIKESGNTLYAIWSRNPVTVTYHSNGGSFKSTGNGTITQQIPYGSKLLADSMPELNGRFGYEFVGWYPVKHDEVLEGNIHPDGVWTDDKNVTETANLYACWKQVPFPIGDGAFGGTDKYEQLLREAVGSARSTINIHLYDNIELTDAIRASKIHVDGLNVNFVSKMKHADDTAAVASLTQTGQERHFYIRTSGMKVNIVLDNIWVDSESGYGGIEVSKGELSLTGGMIQNITRHTSGGAILAADGAVVNLSSITMKNNRSNYGGAIYLSDNVKAVLDHVLVDNNAATYGGGIYLADNAQLITDDTTLHENKAENSGGGIYLAGETVTVDGTDTKFNDNISGTHGGGIGLGILDNAGKVLLDNITLTNPVWNNNTSGSSYTVDEVKVAHKDLYSHLAGGESNVWNGNNISYLYNIYTVKYDKGDAPISTDLSKIDSLRFGEDYPLLLPAEGTGVREITLDKSELPWVYRSLAGWSDDRYGTKPEDAVGTWTFSGDVTDITLYPVWKTETAAVTFHADEGRFTITQQELDDLYPNYNIIISDDRKTVNVTVEKGIRLTPPDSSYLGHSNSNMHFQYWANKDGANYDFSDYVADDILLQAKWGTIPNDQALLVFHTDGGTYLDPITVIDVSSNYYDTTSAEYEKIWSVSKTGSDFSGWFLDEACSIELNKGDPIPVSGGKETHLYVKWTIKKYVLTVKNTPQEGGTTAVSMDNKTLSSTDGAYGNLSYGSKLSLKAQPKEGWHFTGWEIKDTLSDAVYVSDLLELTLNQDTEVTAHFAKQTHLVNFYEGSRLLLTIPVKHGETFPADIVPEAPEGHTQTWYTSTDSDKVEVTFSGDTAVTENLNFYRETTPIEYTVSFYRNDGDNSEPSFTRQVKYDDLIKDTGETISRDYYGFAGWSVSEFTNLPWNLEADTVRHDMKLYAVWNTIDAPAPTVTKVESPLGDINFDNPEPLETEANSYISFVIQAKAAVPDPVDTSRDVLTYQWVVCDEYGNPLRIMSDSELIMYMANFQMANTYYCYVEVTNTNENYSGKTSASLRSGIIKITVNPKPPEPKYFAVIYDANEADDGTVPVIDALYQAEDPVTVLGNTGELKREGYDFIGWTMDGSVKILKAEDCFKMPEKDVRLIAAWQKVKLPPVPDTYTVTYAANGSDSGTVPADSNEYEAGDTVTILGNIGELKREGYDFIGWMIKGSDKVFKAGDSFEMPKQNVSLTAVWQKENQGSSLKPDGSSSSSSSELDDESFGSSNQPSSDQDSSASPNTSDVYPIGILLMTSLLSSGCFVVLLQHKRTKKE